jgi:hypothetical protein
MEEALFMLIQFRNMGGDEDRYDQEISRNCMDNSAYIRSNRNNGLTCLFVDPERVGSAGKPGFDADQDCG